MSLLRLKVQGTAELEAKIKALHDALDTTRILDEGSAILFNRMRTRFLAETDPDGVRWIPSQAAIRRASSGYGGGTLFDSGRLFRSLQIFSMGPNSRAIGTNLIAKGKGGFPYPAVHNFGLLGFPERQFLGFGQQDVALMSSYIIRLISQAVGL